MVRRVFRTRPDCCVPDGYCLVACQTGTASGMATKAMSLLIGLHGELSGHQQDIFRVAVIVFHHFASSIVV